MNLGCLLQAVAAGIQVIYIYIMIVCKTHENVYIIICRITSVCRGMVCENSELYVVGKLKLVLLVADVCIEVGQFVITEGLGHMVTAGQSTMKLDDDDVLV